MSAEFSPFVQNKFRMSCNKHTGCGNILIHCEISDKVNTMSRNKLTGCGNILNFIKSTAKFLTKWTPECVYVCVWKGVRGKLTYMLWRASQVFNIIQSAHLALWVGYRIDPLPCHACCKRRLRQEQLAPRIKGLV